MKTKFLYSIILLLCILLHAEKNCVAQDSSSEIEALKSQVQSQHSQIEQLNQKFNNQASAIEQKLSRYASSFMVLFLFGAFCALWAQNTNRNPWIWFFAGVIFSIIAVLLALSDNYRDIRHSRK